jgi:hypothetical protein
MKKALLSSVFAFLLSACGSDTVNITLLTPIPVRNPTQNLSQTLLQRNGQGNALVTTLAGPSCRQSGLRAGFKAPGWNLPWIPVDLSTETLNYTLYALANSPTDPSSRVTPPSVGVLAATDYLNSNSVLNRPIVIPVPKGVEGSLFLLGTVVEPINIDANSAAMNQTDGAICKRLDSTFSAIKTFAVYGQEPFKTNQKGVKTLRPNVIQTVPPPPTIASSITPYSTPLPGPPIDDSSSQFKCRDSADRRTCTNRNLFEMQILTALTTQVWLRQPPPPEENLISTRLGVLTNSSAYTPFYFPRESPFLMTYESTGTFTVLVEYFKREISFSTPGGRVTQALWDCTGAGYGWVGNIPTTSSPSPSASSGCDPVNDDFNFSLKDLGQGFN